MYQLGGFAHLLIFLQTEIGIDPVSNARKSGCVGYRTDDRPVQKLLRIKYIINLLIFQEAVRMNPCPGHIKILSYKGVLSGI